MEDFIEFIIDVVSGDGETRGGRIVRSAGRTLRDGAANAFAPGAGPLSLALKAADEGLGRAGVPEDSVVRREIHRNRVGLDRYGAFGVRELDDEQPGGARPEAPEVADPGPNGREGEGVVWGIVDP